MLDKILNINPQEKYKSGLKVPKNPLYSVNRHNQEKNHSKDSALFSPLAKMLSKINWKILSIEYPTNDEILLHFLVDDFEFITLIDFNEMYKKPFHEFTIYRGSKKQGKKLSYEVKLKTEKYEISILDKADQIKTEGISLLFDRITELNLYKNYKVTQSHILNNFVNGIEATINKELNYILRVIYTFITTKNGSRVKNNFILKTQQNIPIIMQKVAIIYAE